MSKDNHLNVKVAVSSNSFFYLNILICKKLSFDLPVSKCQDKNFDEKV